MKKVISVMLSFIVFIITTFSVLGATKIDITEDCDSNKSSRVIPTGNYKNIYEITNGAQLLWIASKVNSGDNFEDKTIILKTNIDLSETELSIGCLKKKKQWVPIGSYIPGKKNCSFKGEFDGNNKRIHNLVLKDKEKDNLGLFGYIDVGAYIHDVQLGEDCVIYGRNNVAGIVACNMGGKIFNCSSKASVTGTNNVGGVTGTNCGTVTESHNKGVITCENNNVGGLVGKNVNGRVADSYNKGEIKGIINVAGVCGSSSGTIDNCYSAGKIIGEHYVAGVAGINDGVVSDCYNKGNVKGDCYLAGIVGRNNATVSVSYNVACICGDRYVGGVCGAAKGSMENCFNRGNIRGDHFVGGLTGVNIEGAIGNCYNCGDVFADYYVGGLVGKNDAKITNCYSRGAVCGDYYVGSIIGQNTGIARDMYWNNEKSKFEGIYADNGDVKDIMGFNTQKMTSEEFRKILNDNCHKYNIAQPRVVAHYWSRTDSESYPII